jgi:hypothetical protein
MDRFAKIRELRDEHESALDEADRLRDAYHREIVKLHRSGLSLREIADGLGISHQRVHQIVAPHEETPKRKQKRGAVAGVFIALLLLVAGGLYLSGQPATMGSRASATPVATGQHRADALRCRVPRSNDFALSPIGMALVCAPGDYVLIDNATGNILALTPAPSSTRPFYARPSRRVRTLRPPQLAEVVPTDHSRALALGNQNRYVVKASLVFHQGR